MKRMAMIPVKAAVRHIDFTKIYKSMASLEPGRTFLEKTGPPRDAFSDQEDIIQKTIALTLADLKEKGEKFSEKEIEEYARSISCRYDKELHAKGKATVYTLLAHLFEQEDIDRIFLSEDRRELAATDRLIQAREQGTGVVYLINHSTHWDEFITILVLEQLGIEMPLFAAGSNMMATPSLEKILMTGSYLIIRRGATRAYLATLYQYCRALGEMGKQQGIFLEAWAGGARTRDGSLRYPRRLVTLQGALASQKDVLIQPLVISYSAVPEDLSLAQRSSIKCWLNGMSYFRHLLRRPHRPLRSLARGTKNLWGRAYMNFGQSKLLSELKEMHTQDLSDLSLDEFTALYCMREIARNKKIMASQLTARGIVRARHDETDDIVSAANAERNEIIDYHRRTFGCDPDFEDFIHRHEMSEVVQDGLRTLNRRKVINIPKIKKDDIEILSEHGLQYYATHGDRRLYSPSAKENIVVVGTGAWGFSLSKFVGQRLLLDKKYINSSLILYDPRDSLVTELIETRVHPVYFPETRLPKNVFPSSDATAAFRKATEVIISSSIEFLENDLRLLLSEAHQPVNMIITTRGFDQRGHRLPIQIARSVVEDMGRYEDTLSVLSGPITPYKLAESAGGALVMAGPLKVAHKMADMFMGDGFSVYVCDDPVGVQVAGIMTEVYCVLGSYLLRTKEMKGRIQVAYYIRETSEEVMALALALGGKEETFLPKNPAWTAEYVSAGMGGPGVAFGRQAGRALSKTRSSALEFLADDSRDLRSEEGWHLVGYTGIRSAYLTAKNLNLNLPRLRQAYRIFWKD